MMGDPNEFPYPTDNFLINGDFIDPLEDPAPSLENGSLPNQDLHQYTSNTETKKRKAALNATRLTAALYGSDSEEEPADDAKRQRKTWTASAQFAAASGYTPGSGATGKPPPGKKPQTPEEAGSDIPSLIAMAADSKNIGDIIAGIDHRLPPYKGNNIHAKLLRQAFTSLQLGHFTIRKVAVVSMAQMLWLLAGKQGEKAAREAAKVVYVEDLPKVLQQFGTPTYTSSGFGGGDAVLLKYFPQPTPATVMPTPSSSFGAPRGSTVVLDPRAVSTRPALDVTTFHPLLRKFAEVGRQMLGLRRGDSVTLQAVMTTDLLSKQKLVYKSKEGTVLNTGVISTSGRMVKCCCASCGGTKEVSAVEFAEHAGEEGGSRLADGVVFEGVLLAKQPLFYAVPCIVCIVAQQ